jgi:hypothetical protein
VPAISDAEQVVLHGFWFDEEDGGGVDGTITLDPVKIEGQSGTTPNLKDPTGYAHIRTRQRIATPDPFTGYYAVLALATNDPDVDAYGGRRVQFSGYDPYVIQVPYNAPTTTVDAKMAAAIPSLTVGQTVRALWLIDAPDGTAPPAPVSSYYTAAQTNSLVEQYTWKTQGPWSSSTTYALRDVVTYNGSSYVAVGTSTNVTPGTDTTKWQLLAQAGATGGQLVATAVFTSDSHTPAHGEMARYNPPSNLTITLPAAVVNNRFGVSNEALSGAFTVTFTCAGSDTFTGGSTTLTLSPGERVVLLGVTGGFAVESRTSLAGNSAVRESATSTTVGRGETLLMDATDGARNVSPPTSPGSGDRYTIVKVDASANPVTFTGTVDGDVQGAQLVSQWASMLLTYDGDQYVLTGIGPGTVTGGITQSQADARYPLKTQTATIDELTAGVMVGEAGISVTNTYPVFVAPFPCTIVTASVIPWGGTVATSDTDFWTVQLRKLSGNPATSAAMATRSTRATGGTAFTAKVDWNFDAQVFTNNTLAKGESVDVLFTKNGSPNSLFSVLVQLRFVPL